MCVFFFGAMPTQSVATLSCLLLIYRRGQIIYYYECRTLVGMWLVKRRGRLLLRSEIGWG